MILILLSFISRHHREQPPAQGQQLPVVPGALLLRPPADGRRAAACRRHPGLTATWITRNATIKPTVAVILVRKCSQLSILQLTRLTNDSGSIDSGNPNVSRGRHQHHGRQRAAGPGEALAAPAAAGVRRARLPPGEVPRGPGPVREGVQALEQGDRHPVHAEPAGCPGPAGLPGLCLAAAPPRGAAPVARHE